MIHYALILTYSCCFAQIKSYNYIKKTYLTPKEEINSYLSQLKTQQLKDRISLYDILKRPEIKIEHIKRFFNKEYNQKVLEEVEIMVKYEGRKAGRRC